MHQDLHSGPLQRSINQRGLVCPWLPAWRVQFNASFERVSASCPGGKIYWEYKDSIVNGDTNAVVASKLFEFLHIIQVLMPEDCYTTMTPSISRSTINWILFIGGGYPQAWKSRWRKPRSKLCNQCSEMQQISRESRKSCEKGVLNLTPLMLIALICNDWSPLGSEYIRGRFKIRGKICRSAGGVLLLPMAEVETGQSAVGGREQVFHVGWEWDEGMSKEESELVSWGGR